MKVLFGYIQPLREELKIKEFEAYKAVYCSLCKQLGKKYTNRVLTEEDIKSLTEPVKRKPGRPKKVTE